MNQRSIENVTLRVNGAAVTMPAGASVAAAVLTSGAGRFRRSVLGESRAALCGMGICFECRVTIDGRAHSKSCQVICAAGMDVTTDE